MRQQLVDQYGKPLRPSGTSGGGSRSQLAYDSARDTDEFRNFWSHTDARDADAANSFSVRKKLRERSRYQAGSDGFYAGILETHVNMLVGVGPNLRMLTGNRKFNQAVEAAWSDFATRISLCKKLWCMGYAKALDGEAFAMIVNNPKIENDVQLDIKLVEADQVQSPHLMIFEPGYIDGMRFDEYNNIIWFDVLPYHPGGAFTFLNPYMKPDQVDAKNMLHWFKMRRPGTHRGIPSLTSTMNTGAASRRWREATLAAAETAADFTLFLKTQSMPDNFAESEGPNAMDMFDIHKRMMVALPDGYDPFQLKAEYPTASYDSFHRALVSEHARPLSMPYNLAACDSSTYSFASGKLDTLAYRAALDVERNECNDDVLDKLFPLFFREWTILTGKPFTPRHQWDWPRHPIIDAVADATAQDMKLKNGTLPLRQAYSDEGSDLEDEISVMAEDYFGDASDENVMKMRQILLQTHFAVAAQQAQAEAAAAQQQPAGGMPSMNDILAPKNGSPKPNGSNGSANGSSNGSANGSVNGAPKGRSLDQLVDSFFAAQ